MSKARRVARGGWLRRGAGSAPNAAWHAAEKRGAGRGAKRLSGPPIAIYIGLGAVAVIAAVAAIWRPEHPIFDRFGANVATEALGILITLIFVHRFLERQERARRLRGSIGALRKSGRALSRIADAWALIIKGARLHYAGGPPQRLEELLAPHVTEALLELDPATLRDGDAGADGQRWIEWLAAELMAAHASLSAVVVGYGSVMDPTYMEALDELLDDRIFDLLHEIAAGPQLTAIEWRRRLNHARSIRQAHFERLLFLFALHNELAREAGSVRTHRHSPRTGNIGVNLPPDYDLRVHSPVAPAWWHTPPLPGSLRAESAVPTRA